MYTLREYQQHAVEAILSNQARNTRDLIVVPQGGGKSLIIADAIDKLNAKTLIVSPSKEVTLQNYQKMCTYRNESEVGIFSASFNKKQVRKFTFATIQTVARDVEKFKEFEYIFIDEAHRTPESNLGSEFQRLFNTITNSKIFGFTATPYRIIRSKPKKEGNYLVNEEKIRVLTNEGQQWDDIIYCVDYVDLLDAGYLNPLTFQRVLPRNYEKALDVCQKYPSLIFTKNVKELKQISENRSIPGVYATTTKKDRETYISDFLAGKEMCLVNYKALSTGFDAPHIQAILLLRKFSSPTEYYQTIGRGTRLSEGKSGCFILDMGNNHKLWGNLTDISVQWDVNQSKYRLLLHDKYIDEQKKYNYVYKP